MTTNSGRAMQPSADQRSMISGLWYVRALSCREFETALPRVRQGVSAGGCLAPEGPCAGRLQYS